MRVSKGAQARAQKPEVRHEFPRCVMKAYARSRTRAWRALRLMRGPTPAEVQAVERGYLMPRWDRPLGRSY